MLKVGDKVKIMFPSGDQVGVSTVERFRNKVTTIKEIRALNKGKSSLGRSYTLVDCKSNFGIDYEFCEEWLVPLNEGAEI